MFCIQNIFVHYFDWWDFEIFKIALWKMKKGFLFRAISGILGNRHRKMFEIKQVFLAALEFCAEGEIKAKIQKE